MNSHVTQMRVLIGSESSRAIICDVYNVQYPTLT